MRRFLAALPLALLLVHCSASTSNDDSATSDALSSGKHEVEGCEEARLISEAPPERRAVLKRAFGWLHEDVPYSQSGLHASGYRRDCSGFISMSWSLDRPGLSTYNFAPNYEHHDGDKGVPEDLEAITQEIGWRDLVPGDATSFYTTHGHVLLFLGYQRGSSSIACTLEQKSIADGMTAAAYDVRGLERIYTPIRASKLAR